MEKLIQIVKFFALAQLSLIALLIVVFFCTRIFYVYKENRSTRLRIKISEIIEQALSKKNLLSKPKLAFIAKNPFETLIYLTQNEEKFNKEIFFLSLSKQLSNELFKPLSRRLASSRVWLKRYTAALGYSFGFEPVDELKLIKLAQDKSLLIALNAATSLIKKATPSTINAIIDVFSQGRRLKQSVCSELLMHAAGDLSPIVIKRLDEEENIYTRIFCYRILAKQPSQVKICTKAKEDIFSKSIDLKIAALYYVNQTLDSSKIDYIFALINDEHWQVRAAAAKLLGEHKTEKSLSTLSALLKDSEWWVCVNAAHSIGCYGDEGLAILSGQTADANNFSFEVAQNQLKQIQNQASNFLIKKD